MGIVISRRMWELCTGGSVNFLDRREKREAKARGNDDELGQTSSIQME